MRTIKSKYLNNEKVKQLQKQVQDKYNRLEEVWEELLTLPESEINKKLQTLDLAELAELARRKEIKYENLISHHLIFRIRQKIKSINRQAQQEVQSSNLEEMEDPPV